MDLSCSRTYILQGTLSEPFHCQKCSFQWPGPRFHTLEAVPKGYYDPQVTWQHIAKSPS